MLFRSDRRREPGTRRHYSRQNQRSERQRLAIMPLLAPALPDSGGRRAFGYAAMMNSRLSIRARACRQSVRRSEEHTSELQSLMRISYAVFCLKQKTHNTHDTTD